MNKNVPRLLIAGGGTGGHVLAGIAIAEEWRGLAGEGQILPASDVLFIGARGGLEEKLVPKAGYPLKLLTLGSLNRVSWARRFKTFFQLPIAFIQSLFFILKFKPKAVLGVGGYASGPVVMVAKLLKSLRLLNAKIGILEQNSVPGLTNRILGRFVDVAFAAFPGSEASFSKTQVVVTGNPVRSVMRPMPPALRNPFVIFVFGGSQGAIGINRLVLQSLPFLSDLKGRIKWVHQTGVKDFERVQKEYLQQGVNAQVAEFIDRMAEVYSQASLLICRSGSSTLAEIAAIGRASILVPLPTAADNHQEKNAEVFTDVGAAILFRQWENGSGDSELASRLASIIRGLVENPDQLTQMETKVTQFYRPEAARDVARGLFDEGFFRDPLDV